MDGLRNIDIGAIFLGLLILGVGVYYTLVNVFGFQLGQLNWDMIWPLCVVALGVGILWRASSRTTLQGPRGR